jgi:uncharacterized 2Fe-2S/4Fe-4S cluster protein (DUF4445 family)
MKEYTVTFLPQNKSVRVAKDTDLLSAAVKAGIMLSAACGGDGICGKCKVVVSGGYVKTEPTRFIDDAGVKAGLVLACQSLVEGDVEITVPPEALESRVQLSGLSEEFTKGVALEREGAFRPSPLVRKVFVEVTRPSATDSSGDLDRICVSLDGALEGLKVSTRLANVKHLSRVLEESDYRITVTLGYRDGAMEMLAFEPGDTSGSNYGFAFDIGTTTVAGQLVDLRTREVLGTRIAFNKQASYGSDVITRIIYASDPPGLKRMNDAILENVDEMVEELCRTHKVGMGDVYAVMCAGNMTMMHLLLKVDPSNIRKAPYVPTTSAFPTVHPSEIGIEANPKGLAAFVPGVSTYIGGDIVSGVLACGLSEGEDISLLIDIGTNGEIVLGNREWMIGSAASAGPAFEGSGLSCGMKAVSGAIQKVAIDKKFDVAVETIGSVRPKGICGSGYIDLLCQMLKKGIIAKDGKIDRLLRSGRVRKAGSIYEFVVVFGKESATGRDITIDEDDIENLKRSKGAIYSAVMALFNKVGKSVGDLAKIYVAGGFGTYLNIENAIAIGLLPDARRDLYSFIGNSSLAGARMSLVSHEAFERTAAIAGNITYVDLSSEPGYMDEYIASLFFPHTDMGRFPSARS